MSAELDGGAWLDEVRRAYRLHRDLGERALAQVPHDADLFAEPFRGSPSLAVIAKHLGGNLRSRWRDFLTSDGEKPDRDRDAEFDVSGDDAASIRKTWDAGWDVALEELDALRPDDLGRTITIRGEPWSVPGAIQRNLTHTAYHTGQVVTLARHHAGDAWTSLSIPLGGSAAFNASMRERFGEGR